MSEPFLGEIRIFGFNFAPVGWAQANGQLLPILQNQALFAILGTRFGGDGVSTFALPDLRGRVPNHQGQGPGLADYVMAETGGAEAVTLTTAQMPNHGHPLLANSASATLKGPGGAVMAAAKAPTYAPGPNETFMNPTSIGPTGSNQPVHTLPPFLTLNFCISLQGIFPSQA